MSSFISNLNFANSTPSTTTIVNNLGSSIGVITLFFVTVMIIIYVIYHMYTLLSKSSLKTVTVLSSPMRMEKNKPSESISGNASLGEAINGKEYSFSFWAYIDNIGDGAHHILSRGVGTIFYINKDNKKLCVLLKKDNTAITEFPDLENGDLDDYIQLEVDYIPLQRWINVVLVVDNEFITLYIDGEIYSVRNLINTESSSDSAVVYVSNTSGDMYVGSKGTVGGYDGYISKVQYFNYSLTIDHARSIYKSGPTSTSILAAIGLPLYGVRSPFYKIDTLEEIA